MNRRYGFIRVWLAMLMAWQATAAMAALNTPDNSGAELLDRVRHFYRWALKNGQSVSALQPVIKDRAGSSAFYLDVSTLNAFSRAMRQSGDFSADFSPRVEKYYLSYRRKFRQTSRREFDQIKKDGRGPLMETEDMDIFFCAQEYEYKPAFVDAFKLIDPKVNGNTATATVVSPYDWKTDFRFKKEGPRWLISAYCVFQ